MIRQAGTLAGWPTDLGIVFGDQQLALRTGLGYGSGTHLDVPRSSTVLSTSRSVAQTNRAEASHAIWP